MSPRRFRFPWRGRDEIAADVDEEIRFHLEMRAAQLEREGLPREHSERRALEEFGDLDAARDLMLAADARHEQRRRFRSFTEDLRLDARVAWRGLRRQPGFATAVVLTLGVGIAASSMVVTLADHVLVRSLPYARQDRVVTIWETNRESGELRRGVSPGNYLDWAAGSRSFSAIGLAQPSGYDLTGDGPPRAVPAWQVSEGFMEALGVRPLLGRPFAPEDFRPNAGLVVLVSHALWQSRFGGDPGVVGRTIQLDNAAARVVGVLPPGIDYPDRRELWAPRPMLAEDAEDRRSAYMYAVGRLREGATVETARADLARIAGAAAAAHPESNAALGVNVVPLRETLVGDYQRGLLVLVTAGVALLVIACANVAALLLARGAARQRELGVRAALGAGRDRVFRQLGTEILLLVGLSGALGLALGCLGVRTVARLAPAEVPRLAEASLDPRAAALCLLVSLAAAGLFGLVPAWKLATSAPLALLGRGGRGATTDADHRRTRDALVAAEVALAVLLLFGTGLLMRSLADLLGRDPGFRSERLVALQTFLWDRNPTAEQRRARVDELLLRFRQTPGVQSAAVVTALPFHPHQVAGSSELEIQGEPGPAGEAARVFTVAASPDYFSTIGMSLRRGRGFLAGDGPEAPPVAVVNETLARRFFPGQDPVGRWVTAGVMGPPRLRQVVGVVNDTRPTALDSDPRPELFIPYAQSSSGSVTFVAAVRTDPSAMIPVLQSRLWEVDPLQTVYHAAEVDELVDGTLRDRWFQLLLLGGFSVIALLLSASGIAALISYTTRRRRREMGVRLALGADPRTLVRAVAGEGFRVAAAGLVLGSVGAFAFGEVLRGMLVGVTPRDPLVMASIVLLLGGVAWLGAYLPARAVGRVDPMVALKEE